MTKTQSNKQMNEPIKPNKSVDSKDKIQIILLVILLFFLLLIQSSGLIELIGSLVGAIFISSVLAWIYFKLFKAERTQNQKMKVILIIAVIDAVIVLLI